MQYSAYQFCDLLSKNGFVVITNFFSDQEKKALIDFSRSIIDSSTNNKDSSQLIVPTHFVQNSLIHHKLNEDSFVNLITEIINLQFNKKFTSDDIKKKLKIGINILKKSYHNTPFHFDNTYLNVVIPLTTFSPIIKNDGALHIYSNIRKNVNSVFVNKFITFILKFNLLRNFFKSTIINYDFGNAYLFNGYNSLHGVPIFRGGYIRVVANCAIRI